MTDNDIAPAGLPITDAKASGPPTYGGRATRQGWRPWARFARAFTAFLAFAAKARVCRPLFLSMAGLLAFGVSANALAAKTCMSEAGTYGAFEVTVSCVDNASPGVEEYPGSPTKYVRFRYWGVAGPTGSCTFNFNPPLPKKDYQLSWFITGLNQGEFISFQLNGSSYMFRPV